MIENINWYPGHMKKTRELIKENLKAVDAVVEIIDSRIPVSSRNPVIDELIGSKRRFVVLGKSDLADPEETAKWRDRISGEEGVVRAMDLNLQSGENIKKLLKALEDDGRDTGYNKDVGQVGDDNRQITHFFLMLYTTLLLLQAQLFADLQHLLDG
jgi:ribosome biogenesis GTPase A